MAKRIRLIPWLDTSQLKKQLEQLWKNPQKIKVDIDDGSISSTDRNIQQMNKTVANSNSAFGKLKNSITNTFSSAKIAMTGYLMVLNEIHKAGQNAKQTIIDLDKAVSDLSVALNGTREEAAEYVRTLNQQAIELKTTTNSVVEASDAWLRQGRSIKETETLIRDSLVLSKVGKIQSADATDYLTSALNGYKLEAEDAISVIDKLTAVDAKSASEAGGLALAMSRTASAADMAGVSMDKLIGWIATVKEVSRDADQVVGNMMKTMLSRMNQVKAGKFIDEETGEALNDMEKVLNKVGIAMRDANGQFISSEIILDELGQRFNEFDSVTQRAIATQLGGAYQYEKVIALLSNYSKALEYAEIASESSGSAMKKFEESYLGSIEAQINALQASFQSLIINSDLSEVYSNILSATTALVDFINQTNALKGVFAGLAVSSGIKFFMSAKTGATEAYIALNKFSHALKIAKQTNISTADFDRLLLLSNNLSASQMKLLLSSKNLSTAQKELILTNSGLSSSEAKLQLQTWGMVSAETGLTAATTTLGTAFKGLMATFAANPIMLVTMAVSGAVMAYQSYNQKLEETRQKNIEASEAAIEHAKSLQELYAEYNRLASIQGRTTSEEEEFKTAVEDITKALGNKAAALEGLTAGTNEYADALAKATKEELLSASVDATVGRKSAEEELQNAIWDRWKGSLISVDANSKGNALSEEAQKAVDIVSDALKDFETINRTWNNLSWDGTTHDDPVAIFEYYNALIKAREQLVLASKDDEELLNTEIYKDMNSAINTMSESLDSYIEKLYEEEKMLYMAQNSIPSTTEEYKTMEAAMVNVAGESVDLQNKFKELLSADFSSLAVDIESVDDAISDTATQVQTAFPLFNQLTTSQGELDKFKSSVKSAYDAYSTLMSGNYSSSELLDSIQDISKAASDMGGMIDFEFIDSQSNSLKLLGDTIEYVSQKYAESVLSGAGIDVNSEFGQMLANNIIQVQKASTQLEVLNDQIDSLQGAYSDLTDIVKSYNETGYITFDQLQTLLDMEPQYLACLIDENGQLQLNKEAMTELANQRLNDAEAQAIQQAIAELGMLTLQDETNAVNENAQAFTNAIDDLAGYNAELANTIAEATVGAAAIRDLNAAISGAEAGGATDDQIGTVLDNLNTKLQLIDNVRDKVNSGGLGDALKGAAKSAGKKSGDAYVEAFEEELSHLQDLRDRGVIDEAEYLNRLRTLYTRYFADRKEYLDEFNKYERQYLEGMKSLYESALSGINTLLNKRISAANESKSNAISAIEEEKTAVLDAIKEEQKARVKAVEDQKKLLENQIKEIEKQIKSKQKVIDSINEEIQAMKDANDQRKRELTLQEALYNQRRAEEQHNILQYSEEKGVTYVNNSDEARKAKEDVDQAQFEIDVANREKQVSLIKKEVDLLNERKESINEQIDLLNDQISQINDYYSELISNTEKMYDNMIKDAEKYWDSIIKGWEQTKSRYEELAEVEQIAKAWSAIEQVFGELGYTVEDVLNGSGEAFEDFKSKYISVLSDMNSNASFAEGLSYASGVAKEELGSFLDKTKETADGLDELGAKGTELDSVASSMDSLSGSASTASQTVSDTAVNLDTAATNAGILKDNLTDVNTAISDEQTAFSDLKQTIDEVIQDINDKITAIQEEQRIVGIATSSEIADFLLLIDKILEVKEVITELGDMVTDLDSKTLDNITNSFQQLYDKIIIVSGALGSGIEGSGEGVTNSIASAIQALNDISFEEGIIAQFNNLKDAIDAVTAAIGGCESSSSEGQGGSSASGSSSSSGGESEGGSGGSLTDAITIMGETANEVIGEPQAEGDGTVIGEFGSMKTAVNDVTEAIGIGGEEGSGDGGGQGEDNGTLIGSINDLGTTSEETLGESGGDGVIGRFEQFRDVIGEANEHVHSISDGLAAIDGQEVECTIKVNIETSGGIGGLGFVNGSMNLDSAEYNAKYGAAHVEGTALVSGNWAVQSEEKNALLAEIGPEIVVRDGRYHVIGLNGAEMFNIKPGDIVFNAEQSAALLKYGKISGRGKAYADGTVGDKFASGVFRPLQPGDHMYELLQKMNEHLAKTGEDVHSFLTPISAMHQNMEQMANAVNTINNINNSNNRMQNVNNEFHISLPNINDSTKADALFRDLQSIALKKEQYL